jgi:hypothetical protein
MPVGAIERVRAGDASRRPAPATAPPACLGSEAGGGRPIPVSKGGGESHTWLSPGDMEGIGCPLPVSANANEPGI